MSNCKINVLPREVDVVHGCRNPEINFGIGLGKSAEAIYQPLGGKVRRRADRECSCLRLLLEVFRSECDTVKRIAYHLQIGAAGAGYIQLLPIAVKKPDAKVDLERLHLVAHSALRYRKL